MTNGTKSVEETLTQLREYYDCEDFKGNYWDILAEDLQNDGVGRLVQQSQSWDILNNREFPLSDDSAEIVIKYVSENLDEYVRDFRNYWVGEDSIASACFGEIEEETPKGFNEDEHDDCGWYISDDGYMYLDMSASGIHIPITQDDVYRILDIHNEEIIEDIIFSDQCVVEVYNNADKFQWTYSGQWESKMFSIGGGTILICSDNIKEFVDNGHFIIKSFNEL